MGKFKTNDIKADKHWRYLHYCSGVEYNYNRTPCECDEMYCRCTRITKAWVSEFNPTHFIEYIADQFFYKKDQTPIAMYIINRVLRAMEVGKDDFEVRTSPGYYGDEVDGITFERSNEFCNMFMDVWQQKGNIGKIKKILDLEYGYLIPKVDRATKAECVSVSPKKILIPNETYFGRLMRSLMSIYKDFPYPIGVVDKDMKLLDGYHRFCANKDRRVVKVFVLS